MLLIPKVVYYIIHLRGFTRILPIFQNTTTYIIKIRSPSIENHQLRLKRINTFIIR